MKLRQILRLFTGTTLMVLSGLGLINPAMADPRGGEYEVSVTNLTRAEIFSPFIVSTHHHRFPIFSVGEPATPELAAIAQDADTSGMQALLLNQGNAEDLVIADTPVLPGHTVTVTVSAKRAKYLNLALMLVTTNDGFTGLNSVRLSRKNRLYRVSAYDAGAENNDENCAYIPGPPCGNPGMQSDVAGEGYIYPHQGILGVGDVDRSFDWNDPVAYIRVKRDVD